MPVNQTRVPRKSKWLMLLLAGLAGCTPAKDVMLQTTPLGGTLSITKMVNGAPSGEPIPVNAPDPVTRITNQRLFFPGDVKPTYKVTANLERYRENSVVIAWDETHGYDIPLLEYKRPVDSVSFEPVFNGRVFRLAPSDKQEMAYLQKLIEPNSVVNNQTQITASHDDVDTDYLCLAASPTVEGLLVYQKVTKRPNGGYDSRLFKRNTKSGSETELTATHADEYTPAFTDDGGSIIFSSDNASDNPTLWKIQLEGGGSLIQAITRTNSADYAPSAGPTLIVYSSFPPHATEPQIWRCLTGGREWSWVTEGTSPQLSPDEREILFLRKGKEGFNQLWLMDKNGDNPKQLTQNHGFDIADPRWSPDGKWIAYACRQGKDEDQQPNSDIWVIAVGGSNRNIQLTRNGSCDTSPAWDRNGSTIYFRSNRGGTWNIWKFDLRPNILD